MYSNAKKRKKLLLDTCVFLHYLLGDKLADKAEILVKQAVKREATLYVSSEAYDDAITALKSKGVKDDAILDLLDKWAAIPHRALPTTVEIATEALQLYRKHGGRRKLHYFDAFHVATSKHYGIPLVTSDKYIIENDEKLGINVINLKTLKY